MRPENESDQAIGILIATAANVSSWRIRLAAYVTRLERVRVSRPSWVQIPHPPPILNLETSFPERCLEISLFHTTARASTTGLNDKSVFLRRVANSLDLAFPDTD